MLCFPSAIGGLGDRIWGAKEGSHWLGALVMTFAKIVEESFLWKWAPIIFLLVLFFRAENVAWWITSGFPYWKRYVRSLLLIPLPIGLWAMGGSSWHFLGAAAGPALVAAAYHFAGKQHRVDSVELGECLAGTIVGIV